MLTLLPDLTPRDVIIPQYPNQTHQANFHYFPQSYSLWYSSSRNPYHPPQPLVPSSSDPSNPYDPHVQHHARRQHHHLDRTPLARLRADEQYMERRRLNVQNLGAAWLKPPGIPKTLHQMREERREMEEHQEAMRREALAQELAEAEAEAAAQAAAATAAAEDSAEATGEGSMPDGPSGIVPIASIEDHEEEGFGEAERDLDDEIPEAESAGFGYDAVDSDEEERDSTDDSESEDDDSARRAELQSNMANIRAARMGLNHDAYREAIARGEVDPEDVYGAEGEGDVRGLGSEDGEETHMFEEEDLVHIQHHVGEEGDMGMDMDMDLDMDADLDDDIPDAESAGGYEHTDTEAELSSSSSSSSSENEDTEMSFAAQMSQTSARYRASLQSDATRGSIDINSILSRDGSSLLGSSSPHQVRRTGHGGS